MRKQKFCHRDVSVIGLGTGKFGGTCPESLARDFMDAYTAMGGNFIDTGRVYGDYETPRDGESEKIIGRWLSEHHCREHIFLSTKGGHPPIRNMHKSRLSREEIRADISASLQDLQTDHVDIYWLHRDDINRPVGDIMETLQSLLDDGLTQLIGVSNWRPERIREANLYAASHGLTRICANQPQFSLAVQVVFPDDTLISMDMETYHMHKDTGMVCCCFSAQAHGFFIKLHDDGADKLPANLKQQYFYPINMQIYERIQQVQNETKLDIGSIALAYLTCQPFPSFALVAASKIEQILALQKAGDAVLTEKQLRYLRTMD